MYVYLSHKHTYYFSRVECKLWFEADEEYLSCSTMYIACTLQYTPAVNCHEESAKFSPATNFEDHDTDTLGHCVIYHKAYHLHKPFRALIKPEMN